MIPADFTDLVLPAARTVHAATSLPVSFLIGQWAHETGFGESPAFLIDHNLAGLKPWWGDSRPGVTGYNHYADLADWARGYIDFVQRNDLYRPALEAAAAGRSTFDVAQLMAPWVGQPGAIDRLTGQVIASGYGDAIAQIIRDDDLTRYDSDVASDRISELEAKVADLTTALLSLAQDIPVWIARSQRGIDVERGGASGSFDAASSPVDPRVSDPYADRPPRR